MTQGRVTQIAVEAVIASTSGSVRVTQAALEAVIAPTDAQARVTQIALEAVIAPTSQNLVVSQAGLEVARSGEPNLVVSQAGIEVARLPETNYVLISQAGIEVAWEVPKGTFLLDARLVYDDGAGRVSNWTTVAATVKAGMPGSFSAASWLPGHFYANALKLAPRPGSFAASAILDAVIMPRFSVDAYVAFHFSIDAAIGWYFQTDSVIFAPMADSFAADAIRGETFPGSTTLDAIQRKVQAGSLTAEAVIKKTVTTTPDARLVQAVSSTGNPTFATGATTGNLMFLSTAGYWTHTPSLPAGWTILQNTQIYQDVYGAIAYKYAVGGETAISVSWGGGQISTLEEWSGTSGLQRSATRASVGTGSPYVNVTPAAGSNALLTGMVALYAGESESLTPLANHTEISEVIVGVGPRLEALYRIVNGTTGTYTFGSTYTGQGRFEVAEVAVFDIAIPFVASALFLKTLEGSFGIDYEISNGHFTIDAIRGRTTTRTVVLEALRFERFTKTFSVAAVIKKTQSSAGAAVDVALNKSVTASSVYEVPSRAVDGNDGTQWQSSAYAGSWLRVDLGASYSISSFRLRQHSNLENFGATEMTVEHSSDDSSWTPSGVYTGLVQDQTLALQTAATDRYWRFRSSDSKFMAWMIFDLKIYNILAAPLIPIAVDADMQRGFDVDAQIGKWFLAEALIVPLHFFADAVFQQTLAGSFTAAAIRGETKVRTFAANAVIKKTIEVIGVKGDVYPPAYGTIDYRWGPGGSITFDAIKFKTLGGSTTLRAVQEWTVEGSFNTEAWKAGRFFVNAYIAQWFTSDAVVFYPGEYIDPPLGFTVEAEKCLEFFVSAFIQPYFWVDADIQFGFVVDAVIKRAIGVPTMMPLAFPGSNQQIYGNIANVLTPAFPVEDYLSITIVDSPSDGGYMGAWNASLTYNYVITKLPGEWFYTIFPGVYYLYSNKDNTYRPGLSGSGTYSDWGVSSLQFSVSAFIELRFTIDAHYNWHFEFTGPTVDALVLGRITSSFKAQAIIQWFFHLDAKISYRHFLVDVWIQPEIHVDAWLIRRVLGHFHPDAFVQPYFRARAALKKTQAKPFTVNAFILNPIYGHFHVEGRIGWYFTVKSSIRLTKYRRFTAGATIRRTFLPSVPVESYVQPYFRVNAFLFRMEFFLYAVKLDLGELRDPPRGFTVGAAIVWHWVVPPADLERPLIVAEAFVQPYFRVRAVKRETFESSFAVDCAIVIRRTSPIDYPPMTVDAKITGFIVKATIFKPGKPRLFNVYAMFGDWTRTGTFKLDAVRGDGSAYWDPIWEVWRYPAFTSDATIGRIDTRSIPTDAVITLEGLTQRHFNVNARLAGFGIEGEIWVEAFIEAQRTVVFEGEGETTVVHNLITERLSFPGIPNPLWAGEDNALYGPFYPPYLEPVSITIWDPPSTGGNIGIYSINENMFVAVSSGTFVFYPQRENIHYVYSWDQDRAYSPDLTGSGAVSYYRDDTIVLSHPAPTIDAWLVGTEGEPWTIDAEIIGREKLRSFIAGADIVRAGEMRGSLEVDGYILGRRSFIFRVGATIAQGTFTIDSWFYVAPFTAEAGFPADAVIKRTMATGVNLWQYAINAVIWRSTVQRSFRVGAAKAPLGERNGYATIDADILGPVRPRRFYLAAQITGNDHGFSVGAYIAPTFKLDAFIATYFRVSAFIRGTSYIIFPEVPDARVVTDAVISGTTLTSATANFTFSDTGRTVTGPGIPAGTTIVMVINSTTVIISQPATGTGVPVTIGPGGPTDPYGNEPNFSRSFRVKIEAGIPDTIPVGNDAEIERLIALILEAEAELDAMYCAYVHYKPQDQTTSSGYNSNPSGTGYNRGSLPPSINQAGYWGGGDIDDCWVVATVWAAKAAGIPGWYVSIPAFRTAAGNPDRPGPTGGTGYHVWKGATTMWPNHKIRKYTSSNWDGFISLLKAGWIASLGIRLSGLPSSHRYGFRDGLHQIGVAYQNDSYYYVDPNQPNGTAARAVSGHELRTAARAFHGGTISATMFA